MPSVCSRLIELFRGDGYAQSVRVTRLAGETLRGTHERLVSEGFHFEERPLVAGRTSDGDQLWRRLDGSTSTDESEEDVVRVRYYVHPDGGMVRVFAQGDPRGRLVPEEEPCAIKSVLLRPPGTPTLGAMLVTSFHNEAFRVTDQGAALPKTRRAIYGLKFDPKLALESYQFAEAMHETQICIPLRRDPVPLGPR